MNPKLTAATPPATRRTHGTSTTRAVTALAALIHDSQLRRATAYGIALDVDRADMLLTAETAAELDGLRTDKATLFARVAELEETLATIRHLHIDSPSGPCPVCFDGDARAAGDDGLVPSPCPTARLAGAVEYNPIPAGTTTRVEKDTAAAATSTPLTRIAEDADDLTTLAPGKADATVDGDEIRLELVATPGQWTAWQTALDIELGRTTRRGGGLVTSHAIWRGHHVAICCLLTTIPPITG